MCVKEYVLCNRHLGNLDRHHINKYKTFGNDSFIIAFDNGRGLVIVPSNVELGLQSWHDCNVLEIRYTDSCGHHAILLQSIMLELLHCINWTSVRIDLCATILLWITVIDNTPSFTYTCISHTHTHSHRTLASTLLNDWQPEKNIHACNSFFQCDWHNNGASPAVLPNNSLVLPATHTHSRKRKPTASRSVRQQQELS